MSFRLMGGLAALLLVPGLSLARELTWKEAMSLAAQHPEIEAARARLAAAQNTDEIARAGSFPTLHLSALNSIGLGGSSGATKIPGVVNSPFTKTPSVGADAAWTIWDFGRTSNAIAVARAGQDAAQARVRAAEERVFLRLLSAFSRVGLFARLEEIADARFERVSVIQKEVVHYVSVGLRSPVDQHLMEALLLSVQGRLAELKGLRQAAEFDLMEVLSLKGNDPLACRLTPPERDLPPEQDFFGLAERMPQPVEARAKLERARAARRAAQAERWPRLVGVGSVAWADGHRLVDDDDYSAGLGLRLPLFDGFRTKARINQTNRREEAAQAELNSVLEMTRSRLKRLYALAGSAAVQQDLAEEEKRTAKKAYDLGQKRYLNRQANLSEFREAEAGYYRAVERRTRTGIEHWRQGRLVELVTTMGAP